MGNTIAVALLMLLVLWLALRRRGATTQPGDHLASDPKTNRDNAGGD